MQLWQSTPLYWIELTTLSCRLHFNNYGHHSCCFWKVVKRNPQKSWIRWKCCGSDCYYFSGLLQACVLIPVVDMGNVTSLIHVFAKTPLTSSQTVHSVLFSLLVCRWIPDQSAFQLEICPFGYAWADKAYDENSAHAMAECSNQGKCNRKEVCPITFSSQPITVSQGVCACFPGFEGRACERGTIFYSNPFVFF